MRYISRKRVVLFSLGLLIFAAAVMSGGYVSGRIGQNQNTKPKDEEVTVEKATIRDGNKRLRVKEGFVFVQEGKNRISLRSYSTGLKIKGDISCYCDEGGNKLGFCEARTSSDGKATECSEYGCSGCGMHIER